MIILLNKYDELVGLELDIVPPDVMMLNITRCPVKASFINTIHAHFL